jgi:hypothetical protein
MIRTTLGIYNLAAKERKCGARQSETADIPLKTTCTCALYAEVVALAKAKTNNCLHKHIYVHE